jgi:hypothetical protein
VTETLPVGRLFSEGVIIVMSILLAFTIDRAYESYRERREVGALLGGLEGDFQKNHDDLLRYESRRGVELAHTVAVLEALSAEDGKIPPDSLGHLLGRLYTGGTFEPRMATLDQIQSSGRAEAIPDSELRTLIAEWRLVTSDVIDAQARWLRMLENQIYPMLVSLGVSGPAESLRLPPSTHGRLNIEPVMAARLDAQLRQYAVMVEALRNDLSVAAVATEAVLSELTHNRSAAPR